MSINYTILGLLTGKEMSGYDLKKIIQELDFLPWSGNNNQVYKALIQLQDQDLVKNRIEHQEGAPSKKIYSITQLGEERLRSWSRDNPPSLPEFKKLFLAQLAFAGEEGESLLSQYESSLQEQLAYYQEKRERQTGFPKKTQRETYIWDMLYENLIASYQCELAWARKTKKGLGEFHEDKSHK